MSYSNGTSYSNDGLDGKRTPLAVHTGTLPAEPPADAQGVRVGQKGGGYSEPIQERGRHEHDRYMPGLDGLRALAVFAVIAYHLNLKWAPDGLLGVGLFFVLSGYLITDLLVAEWKLNGGIDLKDFWLRRARRLLPALFVMLAGVMTWIAFCDPSRLSLLWGDVLAAVLYVSNWWFIFHHVSYFARFGPPSPLGHLWSLAVEEQFYLVWPLLLWLGLRYVPRRGRLVGLILLGALASALAMSLIYQPGTDPSLKKLFPGIVVDARVGRQMYQAGAAVAQLKAQGKLGDRVIIELGTNGPFSREQLTALLSSLGPVRQIILVNTRVPRAWESVVNQTLAQVAAGYPHTTLVDWYAASAGHAAYFYQDGVHLNPTGAQAYAALVAKAIAP